MTCTQGFVTSTASAAGVDVAVLAVLVETCKTGCDVSVSDVESALIGAQPDPIVPDKSASVVAGGRTSVYTVVGSTHVLTYTVCSALVKQRSRLIGFGGNVLVPT